MTAPVRPHITHTLVSLLLLFPYVSACSSSCDPTSSERSPTLHAARDTLHASLHKSQRTASSTRSKNALNALRTKLDAAHETTLQTLRNTPRPFHSVLVIGDSMSGPVGVALRDLFQAKHTPLHFESEGNDALHNWQRTKFKRFEHALTKHADAQTVVIIMGTNDALHQTPHDLIPAIQRVEQSISPRNCYWVGPPKLWTRDTGIADLLATTTQHCTHLDSRPIRFERGRDGWHPTRDGATTWAKHIFAWMQKYPPHNVLAP